VRARYPDKSGFVTSGGLDIYYEVHGDGEPTILLLPTWPIIDSRTWKAQVPYLARHFRVVTFDPRGNGRSARPQNPENYADEFYVADALEVLDATETDRAVVVGLCTGVIWALRLAAHHSERVAGLVAIGGGIAPLAPPHPERTVYRFDDDLASHEGWAKVNRAHWRKDFRDFVEFFFDQLLAEPHSTKQWEDAVAWALETDGETLINSADGSGESLRTEEDAIALCESVRCPVLVVHGTGDRCQPLDRSKRVSELTGGSLVTIDGGGHLPHARDPVKVNGLIKSFVESIAPAKPREVVWTRALSRPRRVLYVSSPIGLGHARRDMAIADELRKLHPDVQVDWLAQHPVTEALAKNQESIHPASRFLASETAHIESECGEHDLHVFQAIRDMDEILVNNFMVFHDLVQDDYYDLWIADEGWELDYFLHENPELKSSGFVWLTDFVGWVPMPGGGEREAFVSADYNAEMIEQIARYPRLRDRSIFVGNPDDIVPLDFGPNLPSIRSWTEEHFEFSGYVTGFNPKDFADRSLVRRQLGFTEDEKICIVTVGGSGVGAPLLRKVLSSFPAAKRLVPELRMIVVAGPRIDPTTLPAGDGLEVRAFVPDLHRYLAACDIAISHGGLTTTMELTAAKRPFLYFPIRNHFEQNFHVRHRLERYGSGRVMDYGEADNESIAAAIAEEIVREPSYLDVESDGAARAAELIAELL
jgi:pimeloyl-ACP methyl ester carboxylesterase/predicted glycosyltransferase